MQQIRDSLAAALRKEGLSADATPLELTADLLHGDYTTNIAMKVLAQSRGQKKVELDKSGMYSEKQLKDVSKIAALPEKNPHTLAERLIASMGSIEGVSKIDIAGPGFINFTLAPKYLFEMLDTGRTHGDAWGTNVSLKGKKIMVEYTDPNPLKEFHIGHLMSNAIGEAIVRLLEYSGADVRRANYQGDVGLHVAKALWGKLQKPDSTWGQAYAFGAQNYEENKDAIDDINKKIYLKSDENLNQLYIDGVKTSLAHFEKIYEKLGMMIRNHFGEQRFFDYYFFESASWNIGKAIVEQNTPAVFQESDGAIVFHGEKYDSALHTRVFITSKGLPTYEAKELGLLKSKLGKWGWNFDQSITITAKEQAEYFKVVLAAANQIGELSEAAKKTKHITHGMMRLSTGKMSSRTGDVITGESLLDDLTEVAKERASESRADDKEKLAQEIAVAAIKFQILKGGTSKDIIFERERALSVEGDSGPYLQYTHARTWAIVEKAKESGISPAFDANAEAPELARLIYRFQETVMRAQEELEPHLVANYLISVASAFNSWYAQEQILDGTSAAAHKVALTDIARQTLKNGLWLLGIPAPEKV